MFESLPAFDAIYWRQPGWLLLALQPVIIGLLYRRQRRRKVQAYADPALLPWVLVGRRGAGRRWIGWRGLVTLSAWMLFALAAAGPRLLLDGDQPAARADGDVLLLVDVSRSMHATDHAVGQLPSRLRRARIEIDEFLAHAPGHRVGIILFAARAHLYVPLSADYHALRHYVALLDRLVLPTAGSRPQQAVDLGQGLLEASSEGGVMILLSDGDWPMDEAGERSRFPVFVLGIGTEAGGAIPLADGRWLRHDGKAVVSRLDEAGLRRFAQRQGGSYSRVERDDRDWRRLYDQGVARYLPHRAVEDGGEARWRELYQWALAPGLVLLMLALSPGLTGFRSMPMVLPALGLLSLLSLSPGSAEAGDLSRQAYERYRQQDYAAAAAIYRQVPGYGGRLGEGVAYYRLGDYGKAVGRFIAAVLAADGDQERATALFNLGNSYFQRGDYANAATSFGDALIYRPDHEASRFNLGFSRSLQAAVEEAGQRQGGRPGSGPRSGRVAAGTVVGPDASLSLDDDEPSDESALALPGIPAEHRAILLERGLARVHLADARVDAGLPTKQRQARELALTDARLRMELLQDDQAMLWIRLFEREEGFPAPLQGPRSVPGVLPW